MEMSRRIRLLREAMGLTMQELGEKVGVQASAINKYEKGSVENIKHSVIQRLAETLGVSPVYLMFGESDKPLVDEGEERLVLMYRALTDEGKHSLLDMAQLYASSDRYAKKHPMNNNPDQVVTSNAPMLRKTLP